MGKYSEESIQTLDWDVHIRKRPGMYIGKLGDGSSQDDGIYVLLKEIIDNSIDEFIMGYGKEIDITISNHIVKIRDYGRGIPLGKLIDVTTKLNTGAKFDSKTFEKSVGLNGIGMKAVNALSEYFNIQSFRDGKVKSIEFSKGKLIKEDKNKLTKLPNGVMVSFTPDEKLFQNYHYITNYIETLLQNYTFLNPGLIINFNNNKYFSKNGLLDLLNEKINSTSLYPIIHLKGDDIEIALTHRNQYNEEYYPFVNGQFTSQGGTHLSAFKEGFVKTIREFYKKDFDASDIKTSLTVAISIKVIEPIFESQTKTKLGSKDIAPNKQSVRNFVVDFIKENLGNFLHKNSDTAGILLKKIQESQRERKAILNIKKTTKDYTKRINLNNKRLRDCRIHYNSKDERRLETTIFITEGDSASGSITKSRDVYTQAVFTLKGKPLNTYGLSKKIIYKNEEFNLLKSALNIENNIEKLRYNNVVIATDADVDGMHIRLLLITFFLQFFSDLIKNHHLKILQTPLFRVRNKKKTIYCYSDKEKKVAVKKLSKNAEITRFKGLGEISPDEFKHFIGKEIRLDSVIIDKNDSISELLSFYMGKNTPERQEFIINNLHVVEDTLD